MGKGLACAGLSFMVMTPSGVMPVYCESKEVAA